MDNGDHTPNIRKLIFALLVFFCAVLLTVVMKTLSSFIIPIVVAILLSSVFYSIVATLNKKLHIPWVIGIVVILLIVLLAVLALSSVITASVTTFVKQYTNYENVFLSVYKKVADTFDLSFNDDKNFLENMWGFGQVRQALQGLALKLSGGLINIVKSLGLMLLYIAFFLIEVRNGGKKIDAIFHGKNNERVNSIIADIVFDIKTFLSTKFLISLLTGICTFLACFATQVQFAILWAFLAFVMNFIPTFGSIFSVLITTLFAFLQFFPSPAPTLFIFIAMVVINMVLGNVIEPRIEGDNLDISPFVILVSLAFWGWMWGFIGMILAVPLMVIIKIVCSSSLFPFLRPIAILIGNTKKKRQIDTIDTKE